MSATYIFCHVENIQAARAINQLLFEMYEKFKNIFYTFLNKVKI
jgi:hypothetical protein